MTGTANANIGVPMFYPNMLVVALVFVPVVVLEGVIFKKQLDIANSSAFLTSTLCNACSTFIGLPFLWFLLLIFKEAIARVAPADFLFILPADNLATRIVKLIIQSPWLYPQAESSLEWMIPAAMLFFLVPAFFFSWMIEYLIVRWRLIGFRDDSSDAKLKAARIKRACFAANIASHIFMALVIFVWWMSVI
jgi:hypothetical protein